ncbi:MAG TPA: LytTR family DNA-binding domain-containing protein [Patescibacteria group bacterium]|nr:LytTR family DNA-binding domain-containing protein [Patescibacteria group bacterium]
MRILVVDDEPLARTRLRALVGELAMPGVDVVGEAVDGVDAILAHESAPVDVILLDIAMPRMDGLEAARHLSALESPPAVIFCTAFDEHALAAFEAHAVDYLVKPVSRERLRIAIERARKFTADQVRRIGDDVKPQSRSHICARIRGSLRLVPVGEIAYFLAEDKYVVVHHDNGEVLIEESLKALEDEFSERFVRIHRNCLVAIDRITALERNGEGGTMALVRGARQALEVSRRCLPTVRELVKHL